jgi:outer membrane protein assembly factor BamE (lipoprotein component of BamABCDE complex)
MRFEEAVSFSRQKTKLRNHLVLLVKPAMAATLAMALAGCIPGYDGDIVHGYQADQRSLEQVRVGSSAEQVLVLLGTPSTTSTVGGDAWYYITSETRRMVAFMDPKIVDRHIYAVYFDKGKKVLRVANYGMEDGKVIDFVSRSTPTGGAESTFLRGMFLNLLKFG